jgi:hypothetical protein
MAEKRTTDEIYRQQQIGEFMTTWDDFPRPGLTAWADRRKAGLMGNAKSSRHTPKFRPFDMLAEPNQSLVILANANHRIGVESVFGVQDAFHRYVDADMIYFQYCGTTRRATSSWCPAGSPTGRSVPRTACATSASRTSPSIT